MPTTVRDRGLTKIMKALAGANLVAKVGIQGVAATAVHPKPKLPPPKGKKPSKATGGGSTVTNVQLGVVHEFGSPIEKIPARSFMRSTADEQKEKYFRILMKGVQRTTDSKGAVTLETGLGIVAETIAADMKKKIVSNVPPALSPKYAALKKRAGKGTKTLRWSGVLMNSITPTVVKG